MRIATPGEEVDMTEPSLEAFDRQEVMVLMSESHTGWKQKHVPIIRSDNGEFFGFGESNLPVLHRIKGRFAQILPPKVTTAEHRMVAEAMLKVKGVNFAKPGTAIRLSSLRH
jgi:hypothetical protein